MPDLPPRRRRPRRRRDGYRRREFLNSNGHGTIALVYASFHLEEEDGDNNGYANGSLTIGDCSRQVTLELGMHNAEEAANTQHKIDLLYQVVGEIRRRVHRAIRVVPRLQHTTHTTGT